MHQQLLFILLDILKGEYVQEAFTVLQVVLLEAHGLMVLLLLHEVGLVICYLRHQRRLPIRASSGIGL